MEKTTLFFWSKMAFLGSKPFPSDWRLAAGVFFCVKNVILGEKIFLGCKNVIFIKNVIFGQKIIFFVKYAFL